MKVVDFMKWTTRNQCFNLNIQSFSNVIYKLLQVIQFLYKFAKNLLVISDEYFRLFTKKTNMSYMSKECATLFQT